MFSENSQRKTEYLIKAKQAFSSSINKDYVENALSFSINVEKNKSAARSAAFENCSLTFQKGMTGVKVTVKSSKDFQNEVCRMTPSLNYSPQLLLRWEANVTRAAGNTFFWNVMKKDHSSEEPQKWQEEKQSRSTGHQTIRSISGKCPTPL